MKWRWLVVLLAAWLLGSGCGPGLPGLKLPETARPAGPVDPTLVGEFAYTDLWFQPLPQATATPAIYQSEQQQTPAPETAPDELEDGELPIPPGWRKFYGDRGRYEVHMPAEPDAAFFNIPTQNGNFRLYENSCATKRTLVQASHFEYPDLAGTGAKAQNLLDDCRDGMVNFAGWRISQEKRSQVNGFPARMLRCDAHDAEVGDVEMMVMMIITRTRLYMIVTGHSHDATGPEKADLAHFRQSFRLHHSR